MSAISEKQNVSHWIPFFEIDSPLSVADRALFISMFQNAVLASYRNSELVPWTALNDPTDQALALSLSECGKNAGALLAARERDRLELCQEQITLIEHRKKIEILHQAALDQLELSKNSLVIRIKDRITLTFKEFATCTRLGDSERAQYLWPILNTFRGNLPCFQKEAKKIANDLQNQEYQTFSLEIFLKENNPAQSVLRAAASLKLRIEQLRDMNCQLAQENKEKSVSQEQELISRKKTHAQFFKGVITQIEALQQTTLQDLPSWTSKAFSALVARILPGQSAMDDACRPLLSKLWSAAYTQDAASCQHRFTLFCDDVVRLAKEADLFTGNS